MKVRSTALKMSVVAVAVMVIAALYSVGSLGPGGDDPRPGTVVRAEVTLDSGSFSAQLTTDSSLTGLRRWADPGRTYAGTYVQDVPVKPNERIQVYLTASTDIDRKTAKRKLSCQLYENGKALPGPAKDIRLVRRGEAGVPVSCTALVIG